MPYQITYEPGSRDLLILSYTDAVGSDQFYTALTSALRFPRDNAVRFDLIFELTDTQPTPLDVLPKLHAAAALPETVHNLGLIVLVVNNAFTQTLVTAFIQLYPNAGKYYRIVNTMDEARRLITSQHPPSDMPDL